MTQETYHAEKMKALYHLAALIGFVVTAVLLLAAIAVLAAYHWLALFATVAGLAGLIHLHTRSPRVSILDDLDDLIASMKARGLTPDYLTLPESKLRRFTMVLNETTGADFNPEHVRSRLNGTVLPNILYRDIPVRFGHTLGAFRNPKVQPEVSQR
jgi:hypothetical protein